MGATSVQLKISLQDTEPPVWRRIRVPGSITLDELHTVFQTAMGWLDYHLHLFEIDGVVYAEDAEEMDFDLVGDESDTKLSEVIRTGARFRYEYDFGDGWQHLVEVEQISSTRATPPVHCLEGERACPPEDCGGASGFARLLRALAEPDTDGSEELIEAFGDFEPDYFDADDVNEQLAL